MSRVSGSDPRGELRVGGRVPVAKVTIQEPVEEPRRAPVPSVGTRLRSKFEELISHFRGFVGERRTQKRTRPHRNLPWKRHLRRWAWRIAAIVCAMVGFGLLSFSGLLWYYGADLPKTSELKHYNPPQVTRILARDGMVLGELFVERRTVVPIADVPSTTLASSARCSSI